MQRFLKLILCFIVITILNSCSTDFDVTAPYKETTVVYGLLNCTDTMQWVRINKAYLGEGNAYDMAQQPDSINYPDILDVKLEEYSEGNILLKSLNLIRDSSIQKEPGIFATTPNIQYRTSGNVNEKINQNSSYKLVIYNRQSGKTVASETNIVDSIYMSYPYSTLQQINWYGPAPVVIKWQTVPEGVDYQLTIRFHYDEVNLANPSDVQSKYLDWTFPEQVPENSGQSQTLGQQIGKDDFYYFVKTQVAPNPDVKRVIGALDFIFAVAASEFYTYIQVNHPPTGVSQNIPQYTNVDGGIGIFSSRLNQSFKNYLMHQQSKDSLIFGSITGGLQFVLF